MMLRRRTERKAKMAASSLFKRVASGQDWNPSSPSACVSTKRSPAQSKTVVTNSAKPAKNTTSSSKVAADSSKKESSRTQQKPGVLQKKGEAKVIQKFDNMPKKGTDKLSHKPGNSPKKGVEMTQKQTRSVKKVDDKTQVKVSASPKKESVAVPVKSGTSPKKEDSLVPQECFTLPRTEDGKLPQKLVASPKKADVEALQTTSVVKPPDEQKQGNTRSGSKLDRCVKKKGAGQSEEDRSRELQKDPKVVISSSPVKQEDSPLKEATETKPDSGFGCQARKRKSEPELDSLPVGVNEVCVKLTKLDEKVIKSVDLTGDRAEGQVTTGQAADGGTRKRDTSTPPNAQVTREQIDKNTIAYPSDCCSSVDFLSMIGLMRKSDVKKLEGSPNKLHREAGGKLRRILKPRLMPGMVYRKLNIVKGLSLTEIVIDNQSKPRLKSVTSAPAALQNVAQSKPKVSTFSSAVTKFTLLRKEKPPLLASQKLSETHAAEAGNVSSESKPEEPSVSVVAGVKERMFEEVSAPPGEDIRKEKEEEKLEDEVVSQNHVKPKCVPKKKPEPVKPCAVPIATSDLEPMARRSARQQGNKRRVWGHLLRANPDEFEESSKWDTGLKDPPQNPPKTRSLEDGAKKPADTTTNDDLTVVDVVSGALSEQEKTGEETNTEKPAKDSEVECSQEPDSNLTGTSFATPVLQASTEMPCPGQSAPVLKSSPGSKTLQLAGKKRKKVPKESTGKCPRNSKALGLTDKIKAAKKTEEENRVTNSRSNSKVESLDVLAFSNYSFLSYRYKDVDCQTPHMCSVCWVNDHMYCRNMKRTTEDLPPFGGCIHYIPCIHYWPPNAPPTKRSPSGGPSLFHYPTKLESTTCGVGDRSDGSSTTKRCWNDEDLMCQEEMIESDSESPSPIAPEGTEILGIHLKTRAQQIIRSLGIDQMPESLDPHGVMGTQASMDLDDEEDDCSVTVEEYGAELCVDNGDEADDYQGLQYKVQKDSLVDQSSTGKSPPIEECDNGFTVNGPSGSISEFCVENRDAGLESFVCGTSKELASGHLSSNLCVIRVQVQKLDSDRVRVTYPKILEGHEPGDDCGRCFVQKEVKFPTGADEKALNEFLAQEAVRLVNEAPLEGQRKATMGKKSPFSSGSLEPRGTKWSVATAACPANPVAPSDKSKKKRKTVEQTSRCSDQKTLARKESVGQPSRSRNRKVFRQVDAVLPTTQSGIADLELCGSDGSGPAKDGGFAHEAECLPVAMGSSGMVTSVQELPLSGKVSQVALEQVSPSVCTLPKMEQLFSEVDWLCSGTRIPAEDLEMLHSSSSCCSGDPIIPTVVTSSVSPHLVHPVDGSAPREIPEHVTSRTCTLGSDDQDQRFSGDQDQPISVKLDRGSSFAAGDVQDIQTSIIQGTVGCDQNTSVLSVIPETGSPSDSPTVGLHPQSGFDSRLVPLLHEKDHRQSCIVQILRHQNSASTLQPIMNTLSSGRVTSMSAAFVPAKALMAPLCGPKSTLPCNLSCRPRTDDPVGPTSTVHSSFTGVVPSAITHATGLVIPVGYSMGGQFVPVTSRLPAQITHLPMSAAVCNVQRTKPNCVALANMALAGVAFSNAALTSITLASTSPVNMGLGYTAPTNLASTKLISTNLASMNMALRNVTCTNLAATNLASTNVAMGNLSSITKAMANMASVNVPSTNVASIKMAPISVASSMNVTLANMGSGNMACGNTIFCMNTAGVGPTAMKITRLDRVLAGNHGPLLIAQTGSGTPNAIFSPHPSYADNHQGQSCATTVQSPLLSANKRCLALPLTLAGTPPSDMLQMAWNQCNDDCDGSVTCKIGSGANPMCTVTRAGSVSPTFFSTVDGSNVVV